LRNTGARLAIMWSMFNHGLPVRENAPSLEITQRTPSSLGCMNTFSDQLTGFLSTLYASIGLITFLRVFIIDNEIFIGMNIFWLHLYYR